MAVSARSPIKSYLTLFFILVVTTAFFLMIKEHALIMDEREIFVSIQQLVQNNLDLNSTLHDTSNTYSTFPTYHFLVAFFLKAFHTSSIVYARLYSFGFALVSVAIFLLVAKQIDSGSAELKTLQYSFFPILLPYFFLLYTDITSLLFIFLTIFFCLKKNYFLTPLAGIGSVLIRQNNIIWLAFFFGWLYLNENGFSFSWKALARSCLKGWLFITGFLLFIAFVIVNKGVVIRDKEMHPNFSFHFGNIYFILFVFFFLFMPLNIANYDRMMKKLRSRPALSSLLLCVFFAVYIFTFINDHPYNQADRLYFLRNRILVYFTSSLILKLVFFIPIAYSTLSLAVTKLQKQSHYLLYPAVFLFLIPLWLIEHRYYFIPFTLFMLFREKRSPVVEYTTVGYYLILSVIVIYGVNGNIFFL